MFNTLLTFRYKIDSGGGIYNINNKSINIERWKDICIYRMDDSPSLENTDKEEEEDSDLDSLYDAIKEHDDIR